MDKKQTPKGSGRGNVVQLPEPKKLTREAPDPSLPAEIPPASEEITVVTKQNLQEYTQQELVRHAPMAISLMFQAYLKKAARGDLKAADKLGELYALLSRAGGISIINNINNSVSAREHNRAVYFESIVRKLEEAPVIDVEATTL